MPTLIRRAVHLPCNSIRDRGFESLPGSNSEILITYISCNASQSKYSNDLQIGQITKTYLLSFAKCFVNLLFFITNHSNIYGSTHEISSLSYRATGTRFSDTLRTVADFLLIAKVRAIIFHNYRYYG